MSTAHRVITLRLSPDQHRLLARQAADSGQSINTHILARLGMQTTAPASDKPRGRRSMAATEAITDPAVCQQAIDQPAVGEQGVDDAATR